MLGIHGKLVLWRALAGIAQIDEESKQSTLLALSPEPKPRRLQSTADASRSSARFPDRPARCMMFRDIPEFVYRGNIVEIFFAPECFEFSS